MNSLILVILIPWFSSMVLALLNGRHRLEKIVATVSVLGLCAYVFWLLFHVDANGIQANVLGGWFAPWGIVFIADRLACVMLCLSSGVGALAMIYSLFTVTEKQQKSFFFPLFNILLTGVNWAFITGDLFNLFVAYEVMLLGSYGMMMVGSTKTQLRQTLKYIAINVLGGTFFVVGLGFIYATIGSLNMAEIAIRSAALKGDQAALFTAVTTVMLVVFALKTAAFPLFFWLPDSYPVVPPGINGFFAGLLTKVGVYSLLRVFVMVFRQPGHEFALHIILIMSGFTMLLGVLGAICQWELRRILSWHIVSQVGYTAMGIGVVGIIVHAADGSVDRSATDAIRLAAIVATIFNIVHHIAVQSSLFFLAGIAERVTGSQDLRKMGGILDLAPLVAGLFLIASLSLAGVPPFSGFVSKFVLFKASLSGGAYFTVFIAIITSFLTLYSMMRIWSFAFWRGKCREQARPNSRGMMLPTAVLVAFTVFMGIVAQPFVAFAERAAKQVQNPAEYIDVSYGRVATARTPSPSEGEGRGEGDDARSSLSPHVGSENVNPPWSTAAPSPGSPPGVDLADLSLQGEVEKGLVR